MTPNHSSRRRLAVRFRLWHLLVLMLLLSPLLAWYANRLHYVRNETQAISGVWVMVDEKGQPVTDVAGAPLRLHLRPGDFVVHPYSEPRKIDFQNPAGPSPAIYRWENGRLRVMQASPGLARPNTFSDTVSDPEITLTTPADVSLSAYILQRVGVGGEAAEEE